MTLKKFISTYLSSMLLGMLLMVFSFPTIGFLVILSSFIIHAFLYFSVRCIRCGNSFGVFAEKISFKSFITDECSDCLKK